MATNLLRRKQGRADVETIIKESRTTLEAKPMSNQSVDRQQLNNKIVENNRR